MICCSRKGLRLLGAVVGPRSDSCLSARLADNALVACYSPLLQGAGFLGCFHARTLPPACCTCCLMPVPFFLYSSVYRRAQAYVGAFMRKGADGRAAAAAGDMNISLQDDLLGGWPCLPARLPAWPARLPASMAELLPVTVCAEKAVALATLTSKVSSLACRWVPR